LTKESLAFLGVLSSSVQKSCFFWKGGISELLLQSDSFIIKTLGENTLFTITLKSHFYLTKDL